MLIAACYIVLATGFGRIWLGPMIGSLVGLFFVEYLARQNPQRFADKSILRYKTRREKTGYFIELTLWLIVFGGLIEAGFPVAAFGFAVVSIAIGYILNRIKTRKVSNAPANQGAG